MSKFNWWRRERKSQKLKSVLKGKSKLLQQIEHGDFDVSDYNRQANNEYTLRDQEKQKITSRWVASEDSLRHKLRQVDFLYQKRYNRLYKDFHNDEIRLLEELRKQLIKEFKVDVWNDALNYPSELTVEQFYFIYKQLADEQTSKSTRSKVSQNRKLHKVSN